MYKIFICCALIFLACTWPFEPQCVQFGGGMSWTAKIIETDYDGSILSQTAFTDIVGEFTIEETLGDELYVQAGDISIKHRAALTYITDKVSGPYYWLAMYWDGNVVGVYRIDKPYDKKDDKRDNKYETRLLSIQKAFYDALKAEVVDFSTNANDWNYNLHQAGVEVPQVTMRDGDGTIITALNVWCYSIGDLITKLQGDESQFWTVGTVTFDDAPTIGEDDCPLLYRAGDDGGGTYNEWYALRYSFADYDFTWDELFKLAMYGWNAFVVCTPVIDTHLRLNISVIPKTNVTPASVGSVTWLERSHAPEKYRLDGVLFRSKYNNANGDVNFEFRYGDTGGNVLERDIDAANPGSPQNSPDDILYWLNGEWNAGTGEYGFTSDEGYFDSGNVEPYYTPMLGIGKGDGYSGEIVYDGERAGDYVYADSDVIQITRLSIKKNGVASIEGVTQ